jgi:hypothetical protein
MLARNRRVSLLISLFVGALVCLAIIIVIVTFVIVRRRRRYRAEYDYYSDDFSDPTNGTELDSLPETSFTDVMSFMNLISDHDVSSAQGGDCDGNAMPVWADDCETIQHDC